METVEILLSRRTLLPMLIVNEMSISTTRVHSSRRCRRAYRLTLLLHDSRIFRSSRFSPICIITTPFTDTHKHMSVKGAIYHMERLVWLQAHTYSVNACTLVEWSMFLSTEMPSPGNNINRQVKFCNSSCVALCSSRTHCTIVFYRRQQSLSYLTVKEKKRRYPVPYRVTTLRWSMPRHQHQVFCREFDLRQLHLLAKSPEYCKQS